MNKQFPRSRGLRGLALVELALILPLLLLVIWGVVELGRGLYQQHVLLKAVEAGTRHLARAYAVLDPTDCTRTAAWPEASARAINLAAYGDTTTGGTPLLPDLDPSRITIDVRAGEVAGLQAPQCVIRLRAAVPFRLSIAPGGFAGLDALILKAQAEERYIGE